MDEDVLEEAAKCRQLWAAVLLRAVKDIAPSRSPKDRTQRRKLQRRATRAREWMQEGGYWFRFACEAAGKNADALTLPTEHA